MTQPRAVPGQIDSGKNSTGSDIGEYLVVVGGSSSGLVTLPAAADCIVKGVTMKGGIKNGYVGDIQQTGKAICTAGAELTPGARVMPTTAGKVVDVSVAADSNVACVGIYNGPAGTADGSLVEIDLTGPGATYQG